MRCVRTALRNVTTQTAPSAGRGSAHPALVGLGAWTHTNHEPNQGHKGDAEIGVDELTTGLGAWTSGSSSSNADPVSERNFANSKDWMASPKALALQVKKCARMNCRVESVWERLADRVEEKIDDLKIIKIASKKWLKFHPKTNQIVLFSLKFHPKTLLPEFQNFVLGKVDGCTYER